MRTRRHNSKYNLNQSHRKERKHLVYFLMLVTSTIFEDEILRN